MTVYVTKLLMTINWLSSVGKFLAVDHHHLIHMIQENLTISRSYVSCALYYCIYTSYLSRTIRGHPLTLRMSHPWGTAPWDGKNSISLTWCPQLCDELFKVRSDKTVNTYFQSIKNVFANDSGWHMTLPDCRATDPAPSTCRARIFIIYYCLSNAYKHAMIKLHSKGNWIDEEVQCVQHRSQHIPLLVIMFGRSSIKTTIKYPRL